MTTQDKPKIAPPLLELHVERAASGFYKGFNVFVTVPSKIIISTLIVWAIAFPSMAGHAMSIANDTIIHMFAWWYVYLVGVFLVTSVVLAVVPRFGRLKIGLPDDEPEFSRFSWFAMMFGAGLGIGMLTYSTGEPLSHFANNPEIISGAAQSLSASAVRSAYLYSFLHWGFSAWAIYAVVGLSVGYVCYRRGLPLTIRSGLAPLFGRALSGWLGHVVDIVAVVATVLGIAVTLGLGVNQFVAGIYRVAGGDWLLGASGTASAAAIIISLVIIVGISTMSAISGVGKGIKWLSNLNLGLSFILFAGFLVAGSALFASRVFAVGIFDLLANLPRLSLTLLSPDGTETGNAMAQWQLDWTVFYWAWWIAFAPFVGMFIARISRGRTVREFILGVVLAPSLMCFVWIALIGGTAMDLELRGIADGTILDAVLSDQLYATIAVLMSPVFANIFSVLVVLLLLTYVITSADSAILVVNTINAAGESDAEYRHHIIFWGVAIALVVGSLLIVGGMDAIRTAMIIGALPFSLVCALLMISIFKAIWRDSMRETQGVVSTTPLPLVQ